MTTRSLLPAACALVILLGGCAAAQTPVRAAGHAATASHAAKAGLLQGFVLSHPVRKPSFTLTDTSGLRFPFSAGTRGKLTYLYFGYTHCPDVCPITMATLAAAVREQSPEARRRIAVVFVTVDPTRDTGPVLAAWLKNFYPDIIGLTGTRAQIQTAEKAAGVSLAAVEHDPGTDYPVRHSATVVAYSPDGLAHVEYPGGTTPETFGHDMPLLLGN